MPRNQDLVSRLSGIITRPGDPTQIPYFNVDVPALWRLLSVETNTLQGNTSKERFDHGDLSIGPDTIHVHIQLSKDGSGKKPTLTPDPNDPASIFIAAGGNGAANGSAGIPEDGADARVDIRSQGDSLGIALGGHGHSGKNGFIPPRPDHGRPGGTGGHSTVVAGDASAAYSNSGDGGTGGNGSPGAPAQTAIPGPRPASLIPHFVWWLVRIASALINISRPALPAAPGGNAGNGGAVGSALVMIGEWSYGKAIGGNGGGAGNPGAAAPGGVAPGGRIGVNGNGGYVEIHYGDHSRADPQPGQPGTNPSGTPGSAGSQTLQPI